VENLNLTLFRYRKPKIRRFRKQNKFTNTRLVVALATATRNEASKKRNGMCVVIEMIHAFRSGDKATRLRKLTRFITTEDAPGRINVLLESNQRDNVIIEVYARYAGSLWRHECLSRAEKQSERSTIVFADISGKTTDLNLLG